MDEGEGALFGKRSPLPPQTPHPCQKLLAGSPARSRVAQAVRDSPSPGMMREEGKVRHEGKERGLPGKRCVAVPPRMGCSTRHGQPAWTALLPAYHTICCRPSFFWTACATGPVPHTRETGPVFLSVRQMRYRTCRSDGICTVYGLGYWRICEKMLPSRSSPCWAALAYQRAESVASCGTPKPTS